MKLLFLGTTGYHPNNRRHTSCFMLPELGVVLDGGTGMYRVGDHLQTNTLDILLSHAHLDHIVGLTFIFDVIHQKQIDRMTLWGDAAKLQAVEECLFSEHLFPVKLPFACRSIADGIELPGDVRVTHFPLKHPGGSVGYRFDWDGRSLAYVTDTTASPDADYVQQICGVDVLIHECYFADGFEEKAALTGHSCTTPVAQVAKAAEVGRLFLVHINPLDESDDPINVAAARSIFPATEIAEDGMDIDF